MAEPKTAMAGQYYLLEKIAQGGMAEIYKGLAYDLAGIKKTVCIKKILPHIAASREFIDMLVDEAKIAVKLNQGNIAQIYDLGKAGDDYFIVMEYVEGQSLSKIHKKILRQGKRMPLPIACTLISEIASGLNYMHRKTDESGNSLNIIHRDISPQNIMISYSGTVKIIDFGIAQAAVKIGHTESGILKGKFAYMAPEQARGDKIDHRSDIFSLGVIFHELLTGKRLFKASDNKQTLRNVRRAKVEPPSQINTDLPQEMDAIALKVLAKDRRLRYAFASDFQEDLLKFLHTNFPNFKSSQVAEFVRNLFKEEMSLGQTLNEVGGGATPHLVLDKSGEVTSGGGPDIDWREFMLEADWPEEKETRDQGPGTRDQQQEEEKEEWMDKTSFSFSKQAFYWSVALVAMLMLGLGGYLGWKYYKEDQGLGTRDQGLKTLPIEQRPENSAPRLANIVIESNPSGASVYLDDKETGLTTPTQLENLPPDQKHTLSLYLTNYKFFKTNFETKAGERQRFHVELAIDFGSLKVVSQPTGARVLLDGQMIGVTPLVKEEMAPGAIIKVEVERPGFASVTQELQIAAGKEHLVQAILERLPPSLPQPTPEPIMEPSEQKP